MKVISVIEDKEIIKKLLKHPVSWEIKTRQPTRVTALSKAPVYSMYYTDSQVPVSDTWLYIDPEYPETCTG